MIERVGVIGLGNIGTGMAVSLQRAGFDTRSTAATVASRARARSFGIHAVDSVREVVEHAEVIVLALPGPAAVVEVVERVGGLATHAQSGQLVVDCTTSDRPTTSRIAAALAARGARVIDAPVSGAPALAHLGQLTTMIGGATADVEAAMPVLRAVSVRQIHVGSLGAGNVVKLANNLLAAAHFLICSEAVELAREAGVDIDALLEAVNASTGRSFITERIYPDWVRKGRSDLGFATGLMRKDVRPAAEEINRRGLTLPLAALAAERWQTSAAIVGDAEDITRMAELFSRRRSN